MGRCVARTLPALQRRRLPWGGKGPEGISSDDDDELHDEASSDDDDKLHDEVTRTMPTKPCKGGRTTPPVVETVSTGRTAPVKVAKLCLEAASDKTQVVARAGLPTATHLTMDDDDEDVNVATTIERGLPMVMALGNDRIIGGPAPARMISSARKMAPGKAAKLCIGAASDKTRVVARAGMPAAMHLMMDDDNKDVNVATAIEHGLAMATALGNNRINGGPRKTAPVKAAKLRLGAASNKTQVVARAGLPTATHLTMDDDNEDVDVTTAIERGLARRAALGNNRTWPCHGNGAWQ
jgi:hypothetical protein